MSNFILPFWLQAIFCRCQQHDNDAGKSSLAPAKHRTEGISPPAGAYFPSLTTQTVHPSLPEVLVPGTPKAKYGHSAYNVFRLRPARIGFCQIS
jgi:hypothetical protein